MNIEYQLIKIRIPQFAIIKDEEPQNPIKFDYEVKFSIGESIESIMNTTMLTYYDNDTPIMKLDVECYFKIKPESWNSMKQKDGRIKIPVGFLQNLASISFGTTRGIQYAKTETSNLSGFLTPLVNIADVVNEDMYIELSE